MDAAIEFKTNKGQLVFASFSNRENTLSSLKQMKGVTEAMFEEIEEKDKEKE